MSAAKDRKERKEVNRSWIRLLDLADRPHAPSFAFFEVFRGKSRGVLTGEPPARTVAAAVFRECSVRGSTVPRGSLLTRRSGFPRKYLPSNSPWSNGTRIPIPDSRSRSGALPPTSDFGATGRGRKMRDNQNTIQARGHRKLDLFSTSFGFQAFSRGVA